MAGRKTLQIMREGGGDKFQQIFVTVCGILEDVKVLRDENWWTYNPVWGMSVWKMEILMQNPWAFCIEERGGTLLVHTVIPLTGKIHSFFTHFNHFLVKKISLQKYYIFI